MAVTIPAELAAFLGTKDPGAVVLAAFRKLTEPLREVHNAVVARSGLSTVTIADADPKTRGEQKATISLRSGSRDGPAELAAKWAVMISRGKGSLYIDEARRRFRPFGLEGGSDAIEALAANPAVRYGADVRNLDPVTLTIITGVAVPILIAIIPGVLPMILEWGRSAFTFLSGGAGTPGGAVPPDSGAGRAPPAAPLFDLKSWTEPSPDLGGAPPILIAGLAALAGVIFIRKG